MKEFEIKVAVAYVRVSTDDQKDGFSIPAQIELLINYARDKGIKIARIFEESMSAKDSGRVEFNKMLKYLRLHPEIKCVLVEKTDRLYRNFKDYATMDDNKYEIHLVKENEVLSKDSTSHQKLVHGLKVLLAKNFIDNLREETYKGRKKKAEAGYIVGNCPFGYKKKDRLTAEIVPEAAKFIRKAYELYASGYSLAQVKDKLARAHLKYRDNSYRISRGHLHRMLQNVYYTGRVPFEGKIYEGKFEAIVSIEIFDKVQQLLKKERSRINEWMFTGIIRCARCGCAISAELKKEKFIYYHCSGSSRKCRQRSIHLQEDFLFRQFQKAINKIRVSEERLLYLQRSLKIETQHVRVIDTNGKKQAEEDLERLNSFASSLYDNFMEGTINKEFWEYKNKEIMERIDKVKQKLAEMSVTRTGTAEDAMAKVMLIDKIPQMFKDGGFEIQRELARLVFSKVVLKGRLLEFTYAYPFAYFVDEDYE